MRARAAVQIIVLSLVVSLLNACEPVGLRTFSGPASGPPILCAAGRILPFRLVIEPARPNPVWGVWQANGSRFDIVWPPGFHLDTVAEPVLVDSFGNAVGHNGELIDDAGGSGGDPVTVCSLGEVTYPLGPP